MSLEIIGAGFGRTGTLSLKFALERLGFAKCYHMLEVHSHPDHVAVWQAAGAGREVDWHDLFTGFRAAVDWPSCNFWREQMAAFPDARVILSRRDSKDWYRSVMNTIWPATQAMAQRASPDMADLIAMDYDVIWDAVFDRRMDDEAHVVACYEAHNARVVEAVPEEKLLVYTPGDGWGPLCAFLDCPVPDEPYPRVNSTEDFKAQWQQAE
jgi:hypothetical protein